MKVLIVGDTHGGNKNIIPKLSLAGDMKIKHVLVVGDLGLWTHKAEGHEFLDTIQEAADGYDTNVYAIGGNHENWDHWEWYVNNMPTHKGFAMVRRRVLLAPKAHKWTWAGKQFVGAGGAVSIDRTWRLQQERRGLEPRQNGSRSLWWPNEQLTWDDVDTIKSWNVKADYLFTHDCSNHTPFSFTLVPDPDSMAHRQRIDEVIKITEAKMQFHGHMHVKCDWVNGLSHGTSVFSDEPGNVTVTYGLECNADFYSWGILDTDNDEFYWPDDERLSKYLPLR